MENLDGEDYRGAHVIYEAAETLYDIMLDLRAVASVGTMWVAHIVKYKLLAISSIAGTVIVMVVSTYAVHRHVKKRKRNDNARRTTATHRKQRHKR